MPIKKRGGHRRGAARKPARGARPARDRSPADAGRKHRDAAPAGARDEPRAFGSRKPKGSFGARDAKAHGFRPAEAGEPRSFEGRDKPRSSFGVAKPKGSFGRRDRKAALAASEPRWRNECAGRRARKPRCGRRAALRSSALARRCAGRGRSAKSSFEPQAARRDPHASSPAPRARCSLPRRQRDAGTACPKRSRRPRSRPACRPSRSARMKPACGSIATSRPAFPACRSATSSASCAKARCG